LVHWPSWWLRRLPHHPGYFAASLAALARHYKGKLTSLDKGPVALHPDVGFGLEV